MVEVYKRISKHYEVSSLGNVKRDGELFIPLKDTYYYYLIINGKSQRLHMLIARAFPEIFGEVPKGYHIHHINGNQLDNRLENLLVLSPAEHKRLHQKEDGVSIPVKAARLTENGNYEIVGQWDSKSQAAAATGADYRHICEIIEGKIRRFTAGGYFWFRADASREKIEKIIREKTMKETPVKAVKLTKNGYLEIIGQWNGIRQAAEATGEKYSRIWRILNEDIKRVSKEKLYWFPANLPENEIFEKYFKNF